VINKRDVEASKKRAVATKTGIESTSAPSPSAASMTAALGITSSTNGNLVSVTEETQTSRRHHQMSNVTENTSIVLSGLMHFQQYNIEVSVLTSCKLILTIKGKMCKCFWVALKTIEPLNVAKSSLLRF